MSTVTLHQHSKVCSNPLLPQNLLRQSPCGHFLLTAGPDLLWSTFQPPALMNQLLTHPFQSLPLLMHLLFFWSASFSIPHYFCFFFFHFTSLEVESFLPLLLKILLQFTRPVIEKVKTYSYYYG